MMTDLMDARSRATLSDDEVLPWPRSGRDASGLLSNRELAAAPAGGPVGPGTRWSGGQALGRRARDLMEPLLWLNDGWDGQGAAPPTVKALEIATRFLSSLPDNLVTPDVMASVTGGVLIEWETATTDLIIEIEREGSSTVYVRQGDREEEGPLLSHRNATAEALATLATYTR